MHHTSELFNTTGHPKVVAVRSSCFPYHAHRYSFTSTRSPTVYLLYGAANVEGSSSNGTVTAHDLGSRQQAGAPTDPDSETIELLETANVEPYDLALAHMFAWVEPA